MKTNATEGRLYSLDMLRGLDMLFLTVIGPILWSVSAIWPLPPEVTTQLRHAWGGFTCWDLIMPLFIFMCGAAIPFALERRLAKNGGRADAAYWKHVLGRFALLWFLGLVLQGRLLSFDLDKIRLFDNTLETIAVGYLAVACAILIPNRKIVMAIPIACFAVYGCLIHFLGDYSINGNFAAIVEQNILMKIVPATSETMKEIQTVGILADPSAIPANILKTASEVHYTWYLTMPMFVFMAFAGYYATKILLAAAEPWTKARRLFAYGAGLLALGWLLTFCGVKMVKHIFTVSFTAQAMGWSALLLAALYVVTDIWKLRRGTALVILFGQFALTAYVARGFLGGALSAVAKTVTAGLPNLIGTDRYQPLLVSLAFSIALTLCLVIRRALKRR